MTYVVRKPVTIQEAEHALSRIAHDARAVALVLNSFLKASSVPDAVVVSLALRSRSLLMEATEHLDACVERLEGSK